MNVVILVMLAFLLYGNTLKNRFNIDDPNILLKNKAVHGLGWENVKAVFTSTPNTVEYLPVRDLAYMLDYSIWGLDPMGYHLSNIIYYALACVFLYLFLDRILRAGPMNSGDGFIAFLASVLFLLHPVHVESVAGIAQRKDLVSGVFFFLSLWAFVRYREGGTKFSFSLAVFFFVLSFLSKQTAIVLPPLVVLMDLTFLKDRRPGARALALEYAVLFASGALLAALGMLVAGKAGLVLPDSAGPLGRVSIAMRAVVVYLKLTLWPVRLSIWHEFDTALGLFAPVTVLSAMVVVLLLAVCLALLGRVVWLSFSILWFLISIAPVSGIVPTSTVVSERYLFLPVLGYCLALAWVLRWLTYKAKPRGAYAIGIAAFLVVAAGFAAITVTRNRDWHSTESLLLADWKKAPESRKFISSLGRYYFLNEKYERAFEFFGAAERLYPEGLDYEFFTALYYFKKGMYPEAEAALTQSGLAGSDIIDVHYLLGMIHASRGEAALAEESFNKALQSRGMLAVFFKRDALEALRNLKAQGAEVGP